MEGMVVSAATGAMGALLAKLGALLSEEYRLHREARDDVGAMMSELEIMHAFLREASKLEEPDEVTKIRIRDVRELSYDIEDNIDLFISLTGGHDRNTSSEPHNVWDLFGKCKEKIGEFMARRVISKEIKRIKRQIDEEARRHQRYKAPEASISPHIVPIDPRLCLQQNDQQLLVGLDAPMAHITGLLAEDATSGKEETKVVSIVGCGGLGKTTLAKKVYDNLKHNFDCYAFVSVSRNPNIMTILRELLHQLQGGNYGNTERGSVEHLRNDIARYLNDKRYFVAADDIWLSPTSDITSLEVIISAFPNNNMGSRVIITTRADQIARLCCTSNALIYKMKPLSDANSRSLFLRRIFGPNETCPCVLEDVTRKILQKCGGMPLAVVTISSLLAGKGLDLEEWRAVEKSITSVDGSNAEIDVMRKILSFSYFDLPYHLRTCLLYLSVFPEDYNIGKGLLILGWIGEGFINDGQDAQEVAEGYFNELVNRSLIQIFDMDEWTREVYSCRVHDVILGFINSKSLEENFVTQSGALHTKSRSMDLKPVEQNKIRRLSVQYCHEELLLEPNKSASLHHVRSLIVFEGTRQITQIHSFPDFKFLRVLDVEFTWSTGKKVVPNLGKLHLLKYLRLDGEQIEELPDDIGELQYLETLHVEYTQLRMLPPTITRLQRLVRLYVYRFCILPDDVGKMKNLQVLSNIHIHLDSPSSMNFIQQLGELTKLSVMHICLCKEDDQDNPELTPCEENAVASLCKLGACNLRSLYLHFGRMGSSSPCFQSLNSWLLTASVLQELEIYIPSPISGIPGWFVSLEQLKKLTLNIWSVCQRDMDAIACIPGLVLLRIISDSRRRRILIRGGGKRFECLQAFHLDLFGPMGLCFEAGSMRNLRDLTLKFSVPKTRDMNGGFDFGIRHLSRLATIGIGLGISSKKDAVDDARAAMMDDFMKMPNHPSFSFRQIYV